MNEILSFIPALIEGMLLGAMFFGGLWWTVQKGLRSKSPALWFLGSLLLRTTLVVTGFYIVSAGSWQKLLACLSGFLIIRLLISYFTRLPETNQVLTTEESSHAPES